MRRAGEQLEAANEAQMETEVNAKSMLAAQQQLAAQMAKDSAEDSSEVDAESIPDAKEALAQTRNFAIQAMFYAEHTKETQKKFERLPQEAASAAAASIRKQLRAEAYAAAEQASIAAVAAAPAKHTEKVVTSVAAAMEPYHFALLRAQRTVVEDEAKARSAAQTSTKLSAEAIRLAKMAQELQASGLTVQATQTMVIAHTMSEQSVNTKQWAEKLHSQAGQVQGSLGTLQEYERRAGENAAQSIGVEQIPQLPGRPE